MNMTVYLAGHVHGDWRESVRRKAEARGLECLFVGPQEEHGRSDAIGEEILGPAVDAIARDAAASQMNNLRTRVLLQSSDVVVACFQEKYRQWNTAMDCGIALALDIPLILVRPKELHHALKEIADRAQVVCEDLDQALQALAYVLE